MAMAVTIGLKTKDCTKLLEKESPWKVPTYRVAIDEPTKKAIKKLMINSKGVPESR
jgi:hypothetical protein